MELIDKETLREFELYPEDTRRIAELVRRNPICLRNCADILEAACAIFNERGIPMTDGAAFMKPERGIDREKLLRVLRQYFNIGDSYTYECTRSKEAFSVGTMSIDDFREWSESEVADLCDFIMKNI